jgi:hypothetical protein
MKDSNQSFCGYGVVATRYPSKLEMPVRFRLPARMKGNGMWQHFKNEELKFTRSKTELVRTYLTALQVVIAVVTLIVVLIK